jgi:tetratricopeptide (TPR) repeat protein
MIAMNNKQYEQAIADFSQFPADHPSYLQVVFNRAVCKLNVAGDFQDKNSNRNTGAMTPQNEAKFKELLNDAREDFEIVRELDPDQQNVHWVVLLRNIYYNLGEEAKYQELENM